MFSFYEEDAEGQYCAGSEFESLSVAARYALDYFYDAAPELLVFYCDGAEVCRASSAADLSRLCTAERCAADRAA